MFETMSVMEVLKLAAPLIAIQAALDIYCIVDILRKGVRNLNKVGWILIVLLGSTLGPIIYLIAGKKRWDDDQG